MPSGAVKEDTEGKEDSLTQKCPSERARARGEDVRGLGPGLLLLESYLICI